jgi:hypothetical protein
LIPREVIALVSPIQIYMLLTFFIALLFYKPKNEAANFLFLILLVNFITELVTSILIFQHKKVGLMYSICSLVHNSLWLLLLYKSVKRRQLYKIIFAVFILLALVNLFFVEGLEEFNINTFIAGAFLYLVIFIYESFSKLKQEDLSFFLSNHYLLLFAPVLFFFGESFIFGFRNRQLATTTLFGTVFLYQFINYFVNIVYYSLINIYIYREKKLKNAQ